MDARNRIAIQQRRRRHHHTIAWLGMLLVAASLAVVADGCGPSAFPLVVPDDAGTRAWVRQVVPVLLGRKVKGALEVKLLTDMVAATDRPTVLRALMRTPEFVDHWSETLVNTVRVDREGIKSQSDCYGPPLRAATTGALAQHITGSAVTSVAPGGAFNMSDVVRSAVAADDLSAFYRAHLFALEHHPLPGNSPQTRDDLGQVFGEVFLNRQNTCLACHNSDGSTTDAGSSWNRFYPVLGSFEQALYGASTGGDPAQIHGVFRTDQQGSGAGFVAPWGMAGCGEFRADMGGSLGAAPYFTGPLPAGATITTLADRFKSGRDSMAAGGLHRTIPPSVQAACDTCRTSCSGATPLDPESVPNGAFVRGLLQAHATSSDCGTCHGATQGLWFYPPQAGEQWYSHLINAAANEQAGGTRVLPGDAAHSVLIKKLRGTLGTTMPLGGTPLAEADIQKVEAWINALPTSATCASCPTLDCDATHVDGNEAFAYLAAARIVNTVWQETMGYPLTIANYFPRNGAQRGALWNLTESTFLPAGWSLRELLVRILTASTFNRLPPDSQTGGGGAYREPALFDPWQVPDPRVVPASAPGWVPGDHPDLYGNAMSDGIYRYPSWSLLRSTQLALDWPAPSRFPAGTYPSAALQRAMGQYQSPDNPGFRSTNFAALLAWEQEHGTCANHRSGGAPDWIDRLASAAVAFVPAGGDPALTLRDVIVAERDWLLGDGTIGTTPPPALSQSEEQALEGLLGPLGASFGPGAVATLAGKLRGACGVLVETPQFFLAGIAPEGPGATPRLRVCNGAPCSYQEMCDALRPHVTMPAGAVLVCGASSVSVLTRIRPPRFSDLPIARFCPQCPVIQVDPRGCFKGGEAAACRIEPPACDARCSRIDCCGGPMSTLGERGTVLLHGAGATVKSAEGVRVLRRGASRPEPLAAGAKLEYGDLVELPAAAALVLDNEGTALKYQPSDADRASGDAPRYVLVSGRQALTKLERTRTAPRLSRERLDWMRKAGWLRSADGSTPIKLTPGMLGPGKAEKEWAERLKSVRP